MTEHPILMNGESMRAILAGRKSQTRRVVRPQPPVCWKEPKYTVYRTWVNRISDGTYIYVNDIPPSHATFPIGRCPYQVGQILWVRETWGAVWPGEDEVPTIRECEIEYRADLPAGCTDYPGQWPAEDAIGCDDAPKWRPSIHMPRWASRVTLRITDVRVQRVQEISAEDATDEGIRSALARVEFAELWDGINAKRGYLWADDPWVWALAFEVVI